MTLSTSSSAYSLPAVGYNLRANAAAAQNAPPLGSGNYPNPIEKRAKLAHSHPERSVLSKVFKSGVEWFFLNDFFPCRLVMFLKLTACFSSCVTWNDKLTRKL
jgi:hypothetical protein